MRLNSFWPGNETTHVFKAHSYTCVTINLHGDHNSKVLHRISLGPVVCGILEQPVPQHTIFGKTVQTALHLMFSSQGTPQC